MPCRSPARWWPVASSALEITLRTEAAPAAAAAIAKARAGSDRRPRHRADTRGPRDRARPRCPLRAEPGCDAGAARCGGRGRSAVHSRNSDVIRAHGRAGLAASTSSSSSRRCRPAASPRSRPWRAPSRRCASARPAESARATSPTGWPLGNVVSVGGSWLAPASDIRAGDWAAITARAKRALTQVSRLVVNS